MKFVSLFTIFFIQHFSSSALSKSILTTRIDDGNSHDLTRRSIDEVQRNHDQLLLERYRKHIGWFKMLRRVIRDNLDFRRKN
ncbi:Oidioi.mRNA.OKI2018_I69.PAR.g9436.t1.cds [Oikopleura dioica]|uniref:Oidioi.mRNA.OKI2018_I69.PAR.g9436.t1.cds n=1 Tax=Oikopleura dioica TaxID=34765 RepID=A0ABN7RRD7_OIKDI|nr:Oidioi.mRNA.OKI2018_I69.PAR.g9436.t1.cds [Oikopleura dioica]